MCKKCEGIVTGLELKELDQVKSVKYFRCFQTLLKENPDILDYPWFSDEVWFQLSGFVNSQNSLIWTSENPNALHEEPPHSEKIGTICYSNSVNH